MDIIKRTSSLMEVSTIANLKASADIIEQISDTEIYFGFRDASAPILNVPDFDNPVYSIMKITTYGTVFPIVTMYEWADGACNFNQKWSDRGNYQYSFRTFI